MMLEVQHLCNKCNYQWHQLGSQLLLVLVFSTFGGTVFRFEPILGDFKEFIFFVQFFVRTSWLCNFIIDFLGGTSTRSLDFGEYFKKVFFFNHFSQKALKVRMFMNITKITSKGFKDILRTSRTM